MVEWYLCNMLPSENRDQTGALTGTPQQIIYGVTSTVHPVPLMEVILPTTGTTKDNVCFHLLQVLSLAGILTLDPLFFSLALPAPVPETRGNILPFAQRLWAPAKGQRRQAVCQGHLPKPLHPPSVGTFGLKISTLRVLGHQESSPRRKLIRTCNRH